MERTMDGFQLFPFYMKKCLHTADPAERIKLVLSAMIGSISHTISQAKPFNPLLGETFKGKFDSETVIECEHISHHPSISYITISHPQWRLYGKQLFNCEIGLKKCEIFNEGWLTLKFSDGMSFQLKVFHGMIKGMITGKRRFAPSGTIVVFCNEHPIKGVVKIGHQKQGLRRLFGKRGKEDVLEGEIFEFQPEIHKEYLACDNWLAMSEKMASMKDAIRPICKVSG